ncbi:MAG: hypothetical protein IPM24_05270 [Bryobacterales bacterium]|nr:hypothetical protein [Bryobacterales bacterium]
MAIRVWDETAPGAQSEGTAISLTAGHTTVRALLRSRVRQEVEHYNRNLPETFRGLVQPEESEQVLNGFRLKDRRALDWDVQFRRACSSFEKNGFLVFIDGRQVTELDTPVDLSNDSEIRFLKLVPLVGG